MNLAALALTRLRHQWAPSVVQAVGIAAAIAPAVDVILEDGSLRVLPHVEEESRE